MNLERHLPEFGLLAAALTLGGLAIGGAWGLILIGVVVHGVLFVLFEDLSINCALVTGGICLLGILGVEPEFSALVFLVVPAGLAMIAVGIAAAGYAIAEGWRWLRRWRANGSRRVNGRPRWVSGKAMRAAWEESGRGPARSVSGFIVALAAYRLPRGMSDLQRERWQEEVRADVESLSWALPRIFFALGVWRKGSAQMPDGGDEQPLLDPRR